MAASREDLLSTLSPMPSFDPSEQRTDRNIIRYNDDGSISVTPIDEWEEADHINHADETPEGWNDNLAEKLNPQDRMAIADELIEFYEIDLEVRQKHFQRMKDGLELMGMTEIPDSSVPFEGAAKVTHPLIGEAVVQFNARAIEEFFPPTGPVKAYIAGEATDKKRQQGERLSDYMNYQLTEDDEDYFADTDQMLFVLPLAGSTFKKVYPDPITGMTTSRFVGAEDFIIPYHARSLRSATRYCHRYEMSGNDVKRAQVKGTFLDDARLLPTPPINLDRGMTDLSAVNAIDDLADDRTPTAHEDDQNYRFLEYHVDMAMPWDDEDEIAPPYIVTLEIESREVVAIRRNWKHGDDTMQKRIWFVHFKYLPGLGFYGFGLLHVIGSLAKAVSGAIRALLDSAAFANMQGGFKSKEGAKMVGECRLVPGVWQDVRMSADDLQKAFFTPPFREPSTALAELTKTLVEEGRRFATTTENMVGDASNQGPVGTTLALIEQGSKVFSGIHKRMHVSARHEFKLIATMNYEFMAVDEYPYEVQGESRSVLKQDFDGRVDVIPVSDPNIWSNVQRIAQSQGVLQLMQSDPEIYPRKSRVIAHRNMLKAMRAPDVDEMLPEPKDEALDPVTENMGFLVGSGTRAFPTQEHAAHIAVHMHFAQTQATENPELYKNIDPVVQAHVMEHRAYLYRQEVEQDLGIPLPYHDLGDPDMQEDLPPDVERQVSVAVARRLRPPPQPGPTPEEQQAADEARQKDDEQDALLIGKLERMRAEADAKLRQQDDEHAAEERRKKSSFDAEERRRDRESRAEIRRDDRESQADIENERTKAKAQAKIRSTFKPQARR